LLIQDAKKVTILEIRFTRLLRKWVKRQPMKILKYVTIAVVVSLIGAFAYANVRHLSPTERLKEVHLASFNMKGNLSAQERISLEQKVSRVAGVTACSINASATTASVIFHPDAVSVTNLTELLSNNNQLAVIQKELAVSGGCPVHAVSASFNQFLSVLDLRR
jgi:hypothetical protein